ncbi:MAG: AAA family ATPase [Deltaproteobacteria bacterium]|nr:AAA family ATPase [Deltaproteobacteria bacterium]
MEKDPSPGVTKGAEESGQPPGKTEQQTKRMPFFFMPEMERDQLGEKPSSGGLKEKIDLNLKPEEMEAYLEAYVVRQFQAKAVLATKVCTHFNRIRYLEEQGLADAPSSVGMIKNNIILIGPTGVGKTYLVKLIAQKLGVPFVKGDATKFSETGYVGGDVEDLVRDLVYAADDDLELAQCGIIYLDEIDKIASSQSLIGPDVSRTGVQRTLLKPLEETEVDLKVPHDPISQIQAIEAYRKTGKREKRVVNTRHILFIVSGAFNGLEEVIKKRLRKSSIGFGAEGEEKKGDYLAQVSAQDLIEYGFESEFVGRLPVVVVLDELSAGDLFEILLNTNNPVVLSKKRDFAAYGVELFFEEEALRLIAIAAAQEKTGARGLVGAMEQVLIPFEKRLPSTTIKRLVVTPEMVADPQGELARLEAEPEDPDCLARFQAAGDSEAGRLKETLTKRAKEVEKTYGLILDEELLDLVTSAYAASGLDVDRALAQVSGELEQIQAFAAELEQEHGLKVVFNEDAACTIVRVARQAGLTPKTYLEQRAGELVFGLKLIRDRNEVVEFVLDRQAVLNTSDYVRDRVSPQPEV